MDTIAITTGLEALPIVHGSVECSVILRKHILESKPDIIAVELPESFTTAVKRALPHIDQIPILSAGPEKNLHFILEPLEPVVEALNSAEELGIPWHLIDAPNPMFLSWFTDAFPDTYTYRSLGVHKTYTIFKENMLKRDPTLLSKERRVADGLDYLREIHMAWRIRQLRQVTKDKRILLVVGISHLVRLEYLLSCTEEEFEKELETLQALRSTLGDDLHDGSEDEEPLEALIKKNDSAISESHEIEISVLSRENPEILDQPGYYNAAWLISRRRIESVRSFNRIALQRHVYRESVSRYEKESSELFPRSIEKLFFRFARNWALIDSLLLPDSYRLVMSARAFGNDNFGRIFYNTIHFLPPLKSSGLPEKKLSLEDLNKNSKLIRFRPIKRIKRRVPPPKIIQRFHKEKYPGEWLDSWRGSGICSFPPEDITIEDFGKYLQKKAKQMISGQEEKVLPFSTSLLDGIDYRETIRNLHMGQIFVKDLHRKGIDAGSVVIIFSDDEAEHDWKVVWWGEHAQESDMAFYATAPFGQLVGPGICRCNYGGLMLTYPPGRLHDIWNDRAYSDFERNADKLLAAAIEYNERRAVVHLSVRPPSPKLIQMAARVGQRVIHIPLSVVNQVVLGRVRRFHVLDSKERRDDAGDFIW